MGGMSEVSASVGTPPFPLSRKNLVSVTVGNNRWSFSVISHDRKKEERYKILTKTKTQTLKRKISSNFYQFFSVF